MASIRREIRVDVAPDRAWDALRDVGRIHERLVKGFVTDCRLDGDARVVTFANGMTLRERIVDVDDAQRRVAWSAVGEPFAHHNASVQRSTSTVVGPGWYGSPTCCRMRWRTRSRR